MSTYDQVRDQINILKIEFLQLHNYLYKVDTQPVRDANFDIAFDDYIGVYNKLITIVLDNLHNFKPDQYSEVLTILSPLRDRVVKLFEYLKLKIIVPTEVQVINVSNLHVDIDNSVASMAMSEENFIGLAAKTINRNYSGDPIGLTAFTNSIKFLRTLAGATHEGILLTFMLTKLEGKALDSVGAEPEDIDEVITSLSEAIKPDSSKVIEGRMLALKLNRLSPQDFSAVTLLKLLAEQS